MSGNVPSPQEQDIYRAVRAIRDLFEGRSNAVGTFTLTTSVATTTVTAANCGSGCTVLIQPATSTAATELGNGTLYIGTVSNGSFVVTHANSGVANRTFRYAAFG